jgi:hypothetical protein
MLESLVKKPSSLLEGTAELVASHFNPCNKYKKFRNWHFIPTFFIAHLPILVQCKTKGAVGAVCALLRNWQLGA